MHKLLCIYTVCYGVWLLASSVGYVQEGLIVITLGLAGVKHELLTGHDAEVLSQTYGYLVEDLPHILDRERRTRDCHKQCMLVFILVRERGGVYSATT